jgi:hypothetical protein
MKPRGGKPSALFGNDRRRAGRCGLLCEMRAVGLGACDRDKEKPGFDLAAVGGEPHDVDRRLPRIDRRLRQKIAQLHRVSFALTNNS